jgi:hypothetical protein
MALPPRSNLVHRTVADLDEASKLLGGGAIFAKCF